MRLKAGRPHIEPSVSDDAGEPGRPDDEDRSTRAADGGDGFGDEPSGSAPGQGGEKAHAAILARIIIRSALIPIGTDDPDLGGKAHGLALAVASGLDVPAGFVVPARDFRAALAAVGGLPPAPDEALLAERAAALRKLSTLSPPAGDGPWVVRSSATIEDRLGAAAPGIFRSLRDVAARDVSAAVAEVWASLVSPTAAAYLALRGIPFGDAAMAVLVQEQVSGLRLTAYSRAPGDADHVLVESLDAEGRALVGDEISGSIRGVPTEALRTVAGVARRLEAALGAPADVELVLGDRLWTVQARPIPPARPRASSVGTDELHAALAFSRAEPAAVWTWDATHNPAPLTPAQAGLVALVDEAGAAGVRQRVVLGYLYATRAGALPPLRRIPAVDLARVYAEELAPAFEKALARMGPMPEDLEATLDAYLEVYRLYSRVLAPSLRDLGDAAGGGAVPDRVEVGISVPALTGADLAAAWDVGAPTYGEAALATDSLRLPGSLRHLDDFIFARAQAGVRRALAALALKWRQTPSDLAFLPLGDVRAAARSDRPPEDVAARAARARAELARLAGFAPPLQIMNGRGIFHPTAREDGVLAGRGTGGRARGPVRLLDPGAPRPAGGHVLVCAAALPTLAPLLHGALALVVEHDGLLGHGAALARELGIPCVVGCVGALTALRDGDDVWVDGEAGVVLRLSSA